MNWKKFLTGILFVLCGQNLLAQEIGYELYVPDSLDLSKEAPLVVLCHGCTQTANMILEITGFRELAEKEGFIVLAPEQTPDLNKTRCWNWHLERNQQRSSGELFQIMSLIDKVKKEYSIDSKRVYVTGHAAGGVMAANLASVYPEVFSGVALHSALPYGALRISSPGTSSRPTYRENFRTMLNIPNVLMTKNPNDVANNLPHQSQDFKGESGVVIIHGLEDKIHNPVHIKRIEESFFGNAKPEKSESIADSSGQYTRKSFAGPNGIENVVIEVPGLGNKWSGGEAGIKGLASSGAMSWHGDLGDPTKMDATAEIWKIWNHNYKASQAKSKAASFRCSKVFTP